MKNVKIFLLNPSAQISKELEYSLTKPQYLDHT